MPGGSTVCAAWLSSPFYFLGRLLLLLLLLLL
jgi:hypothetical protein